MKSNDNTLIFATGNTHKVEEIAAVLQGEFTLQSLRDLNFSGDLPETCDTIEGNALQKAREVYRLFGRDCFADDTALEVEALGGQPGVYSARYAGGDGHDSEANMRKLLQNLREIKNRKAQFRTIIALIYRGEEYLFEGKVEGRIIEERRGSGGFGYDPIFVPDGYEETFAQLGSEVKNSISHRARAIKKLAQFLNNL